MLHCYAPLTTLSTLIAFLLAAALLIRNAAVTPNGAATPKGFRVACFVVGDKSSLGPDLPFESSLWAGGFGSVFIIEREFTLEMCEADCDALVFSASAIGAFGASVADCSKPVLAWEEGYMRAVGMTGSTPGVDAGNGVVGGMVDIVDDRWPLAAGLSGPVALFEGEQDMNWAAWTSLGSGAKVVATQGAGSGRPVVLYYCKGGLQHSGVPSPNVRIQLPPHYFPNSSPVAWTPEGERVVKAAIDMLRQAADGGVVEGC